MLKFLFSHEILAKQLVEIILSHNIEVQLIKTNKGWQISTEEDLDELIIVQLNDCYAELTKQDHEMSHPKKLKETQPMLSDAIEITLKSGETIVADIDQDILDKLLYVLSLDEINRLVNNITKAIEFQDKQDETQGN